MGSSSPYRRVLSLISALTFLVAESYGSLHPRDITTELQPRLSPDAQIYFPGAPEFDVAIERWSPFHSPNFTVVVEVAEEEDVAKTVRYANSNDIPFLAVNGGHGTISTLSNMDYGIEIWLHKLNSVTISEDGETATFGGGIKSVDVTTALWAEGKQTVHGVCECTGYLGPALGGGHGALQGRYGLISDQFVSMRVVTADGRLRTVSAKSGDHELWWAMQGAGHNYGIVTSITSKVYDVPYDGVWAFEHRIYTNEQLEDLFELFNELSETQPPGFMIWTTISRDADVDAENPIIDVKFLQEGVTTIEPEYLQPFRELPNIAVNQTTGFYNEIAQWLGTDINSRTCEPGGITKVRFPIGIQRFNITTQRAFFDAFAEGTAESSPLSFSSVLFEQYSVQGVQAVPEYSTAYPHRQDTYLVSPVILYSPSTDPEVGTQAKEFGDGLRQIFLEGTGSDELHAYVNYAAGDEGPESWYGYEPWRQERLAALKRRYDPGDRFGFYAPVLEDS